MPQLHPDFTDIEHQNTYVNCLMRLNIGEQVVIENGLKKQEEALVAYIDRKKHYPFYNERILRIPIVLLITTTEKPFKNIGGGINPTGTLFEVWDNFCSDNGLAQEQGKYILLSPEVKAFLFVSSWVRVVKIIKQKNQ